MTVNRNKSRLPFSSAEMFKKLLWQKCGPRSDCSYRSSLFWIHAVCFYLISSVMLGNYLQQTTSADDILRCIFILGALKVNSRHLNVHVVSKKCANFSPILIFFSYFIVVAIIFTELINRNKVFLTTVFC